MIRRLRIQFIAVCMLLVTAVLTVVTAIGYSSVKRNLEDTSRQTLQQILQEESTPEPNRKHDLFPDSGEVQMPYFTVEIWNHQTIYITGGTYENLEDTEELKEILTICLEQGNDEGKIDSYQLRYMRQSNNIFIRIAFVDISMEQSALQNTVRGYLLVSALALLLLLGVSVILSWWVTRPVAKAWQQQHQFLSDASHELKTPLTVILSNAELLEATSMDDRPARWVDNIQAEAQRMKSLVEEMLTLARADNMTHTSVMTELCLSDIAVDCALSFEPVAFEAGKPLQYDLQEEVRVLGDSGKIRQVIAVLLDNAIKYGCAGRPVTMELSTAERTARLVVTNEGDTIPPEQLSHLFERFYRADASRGEQAGFGLGLSIAAAIAKEHNGTLRADSEDGKIRMTFTLPLKR